MYGQVKKKLNVFQFVKNGQKDDVPASPRTPDVEGKRRDSNAFKYNTPPVLVRAGNSTARHNITRRISYSGLRELIQCSICLENLNRPKMLPCQHTFCRACLLVYIADSPHIHCPVCRMKIVTGKRFVDSLPSNLYIDSLLLLVRQPDNLNMKRRSESPTPPSTPSKSSELQVSPGSLRCLKCWSICESEDVTLCDHCKQNFCRICWQQHLDELQTQISLIIKQLEATTEKLDHKLENFKDRCERITEQINDAADEKIKTIIATKQKLLVEVDDLRKSVEVTAVGFKSSLLNTAASASETIKPDKSKDTDEKEKVKTFMNLHQNSLEVMNDVYKWDFKKMVFNKDRFCVEVDSGSPVESESDEPMPTDTELRHDNPLENEDTLATYYRSKKFDPHYIWRKTSRPCGIAECPWNGRLYICGMDSHSVFIVEKNHAKIVDRLSCPEMLCPTHIAFLKSLEEIYVTDKWKHCVHVFNKDGDYLRSLGHKGSKNGLFRSPEGIAVDDSSEIHHIYVVDTGNDRVQVIKEDGTFVGQIGVLSKPQASTSTTSMWESKETKCTELNSPTSVALTKDRVIVLDSGNRRVKIYNKADRSKIFEFGSLGQRKGQFRQPEVLTVDPLGFIIVGDSGNSRVQIFKPSGLLVRVFGGLGQEPGKFGWISGIHVTEELDIIISDPKNHNVSFI